MINFVASIRKQQTKKGSKFSVPVNPKESDSPQFPCLFPGRQSFTRTYDFQIISPSFLIYYCSLVNVYVMSFKFVFKWLNFKFHFNKS